MLAEAAAIPVKPKTPATMAMIRKTTAHLSMESSLVPSSL
jgi:hypothetical protein